LGEDVSTKRKSLLPKLRRKKKRIRRSGPENKILNLVVIALAAIAIWQFTKDDDSAAKRQIAGQQIMYGELRSAPPVQDYAQDPRMDSLITRHEADSFFFLDENLRPMVKGEVLQPGKGEQSAHCGQKVRWQPLQEARADAEAGEVQTLRLGADYQTAGLGLGMIGMSPGEVRLLEIPKNIWQKTNVMAADDVPVYHMVVKLLALEDELPQSSMPLRRFLRKSGGGQAIRCGDRVWLYTTIWNAKGEILFQTPKDQPVYFVAGQGRVPFGLEQAIQGMPVGSEYSLAIPAQMLTPLVAHDGAPAEEGHFPLTIDWPEEQMVLMDLYFPQAVPSAKSDPLNQSTPEGGEQVELLTSPPVAEEGAQHHDDEQAAPEHRQQAP
jgi:hypothetical protein